MCLPLKGTPMYVLRSVNCLQTANFVSTILSFISIFVDRCSIRPPFSAWLNLKLISHTVKTISIKYQWSGSGFGNKTCTRRPDLDRHQNIHTGVKEYKCDQCNKEFIEVVSLIRHQKIHNGVKEYKCGKCNKKITERYTLIKHQMIHNGVKEYKCDQCNKEFADKSRP